ncbi:MAG TPA: Qat anti-phage system associated protein QatB [Longimicrobium sp.]
MRGFVRAQGGRRRAAASAPSGVAAGRNLARFLSSVATRGLAEAAREFRLTAYLNAGVDIFLTALTRVLAPAAGTNEEAAAHAAVAETAEYLFREYGVDDQGLEALETLTAEMLGRALTHFTAEFINTRLMHVLGSRIEAGAATPEQAVALEAEVKDYVRERVTLDFAGRDLMRVNWDAPESERVIQQIFEDAYGLLEVD